MVRTSRFLLAILLVFALIVPGVFAGGQSEAVSEDGNTLETIRVGVLSLYLSSAVNYIVQNKLDEQMGVHFELEVFPSGAPMNEALGAGLLDVATIGGAMIFSAVNYDAKIIGNHVVGTVGNDIFARPDSTILNTQGSNPEFPEVYGDADSVRGITVIYNAGTTSQMTLNRYLDAVGVASSDVTMISMDFAQGLQAFRSGQGDLIAAVPPYDAMAASEGFVKVAGLDTLNSFLYEGLIASADFYQERPDLVQTFVSLIYQANDVLQNDMDLKTQNLIDWYAQNGETVTEEAARAECESKAFITSDMIRNEIDFGANERNLAEFFVSIDVLAADQVDTAMNNVTSEFIDNL